MKNHIIVGFYAIIFLLLTTLPKLNCLKVNNEYDEKF